VDGISAAVEVLGDRWTLLILRGVIFEDHRYFRAMLGGSAEGISSNILADRLVKLVDAGILARGMALRGQRARYSLTEAGIRSVPVLLALGRWSDENFEVDEEQLMNELRARHLG
jgi:DNA-binding HxlR family transcriptional regulator